MKLTALGLTLLCALCAPLLAAEISAKPNVLFICDGLQLLLGCPALSSHHTLLD